jgi:hypothetical protein
MSSFDVSIFPCFLSDDLNLHFQTPRATIANSMKKYVLTDVFNFNLLYFDIIRIN